MLYPYPTLSIVIPTPSRQSAALPILRPLPTGPVALPVAGLRLPQAPHRPPSSIFALLPLSSHGSHDRTPHSLSLLPASLPPTVRVQIPQVRRYGAPHHPDLRSPPSSFPSAVPHAEFWSSQGAPYIHLCAGGGSGLSQAAELAGGASPWISQGKSGRRPSTCKRI
jgi:hypothetical protein